MKNWVRVRVIVFNANFNNISVISWWSVLLVEDMGLPEENLPQVIDKLLSHNVVLSTPCPSGIRTHNFSGDKH